MAKVDRIYQRLLADILTNGQKIQSRNSEVLRLTNLSATFTSTPLISVRKTAWKNALREMEWFLSGSSSIDTLDAKVQHWWKPWANRLNQVNLNYGYQFRYSNGDFDQLQYLVDGLVNTPFSRRNVITTWNTKDMANPNCPITNCHGSLIMAAVNPDNTLHLTMVQRSADMILGVPHNWIQYWAFLLWLSNKTELTPGSFTWTGHDCHIYKDHIGVAKKILNSVKENNTPNLIYNSSDIKFLSNDFNLSNKYEFEFNEKIKMIV